MSNMHELVLNLFPKYFHFNFDHHLKKNSDAASDAGSVWNRNTDFSFEIIFYLLF